MSKRRKGTTSDKQEEKSVTALVTSESAKGGRGVRRLRRQFQTLLLSNPNYFGNLPESSSPPVVEIIKNTRFEALTCIGFNPAADLLEATIEIKRPKGYGSDLCGPGSVEYVRFYVDYGSGWEDAGVVTVDVYNIPNDKDCDRERNKPLSYVLSLPLDPPRQFCGRPLLPQVRAILSWQLMPPPGTPDWTPVWGDILDRYIQIRPRPWLFADLVETLAAGINLPLTLPDPLKELELEPLPIIEPAPLTLSELAERYEEQGNVEPHRYVMNEIQSLIYQGVPQPMIEAKMVELNQLNLSLPEIVQMLAETSGNKYYEELHCLGLDYRREWLVATFSIKQPTGYNGSLCEKGSKEYIAFWVDWDDTCEWTYLDTITVDVHDISTIPSDGLHYAAIRGVDLNEYREPCAEPKVARVRAVLSWNTPPSTTDPDAVPYWGNRLDTHVLIPPGRPAGDGPQISIIGGISVSQIDVFGTGYTQPGAVFALYGGLADSLDRPCPFGGNIHVQAYAPPLFSALGYKYRVMARHVGDTGPGNPVTNKFQIADGINPPVMRTPDPVTGYIEYVHPSQNIFDMLAWWKPSGDELWEIRLEMVNAAHVFLGATIWHRIQLDNTAPEASITIDGGACDEYSPGVVVKGHFVARDKHFGGYSLHTLPASMSPPAPVPSNGSVQTVPLPGNTWQLTTTADTPPCGYVVQLKVKDRTIVGSLPNSHNRKNDDVGFCLLKQTE